MTLAPMPLEDTTAWSALAEDHLVLVDETLRRLQRRLPLHVDRDDLAGAGRVALVQAARQYDPDRGPFAAFAARRLNGAMLDELRRSDWASRSVRHGGRRREAGVAELSARLGRTPTRAEVADAVGLTAEELRRHDADAFRAAVTSLEAVTEHGGDPVRDDTTPGDALLTSERDSYLHDAIASLPPRVRLAVLGRYFEERPVREIAEELGVSESRVSQLCGEGVVALRTALASYLHGEAPMDVAG